MKLSRSNGFAPGDVVRRWRPCLVGDWKIQLTGVFPLSDVTDATLDCKNYLVSSQNAFSTKGSIIIRFLVLANLVTKLQVADLGCLSRIQDPGSKFFPFWIPDPRLEFFPSRILDPGCISKNLSILTKKNGFSALRNMIRVFIPDPDPFSGSQIPNPGIKKALDPWSRIPDPDSQHWRFRDCSGCRG